MNLKGPSKGTVRTEAQYLANSVKSRLCDQGGQQVKNRLHLLHLTMSPRTYLEGLTRCFHSTDARSRTEKGESAAKGAATAFRVP